MQFKSFRKFDHAFRAVLSHYPAPFTLAILALMSLSATYGMGQDKQGKEKAKSYAAASATPAEPLISPAAGIYHSAQTITITESTPGAAVYYTTDGSYPTASSTLYTLPFQATSSITLRAVAIVPGAAVSGIPFFVFQIFPVGAATPVFPAPGGKYTTAQTATITDATPGATLFYTTDGSTPTANSTPYTGPITVSTPETIRAMALAPGNGLIPIPSGIGSVYYYIVLAAAAPTISPAPGAYQTVQQVVMTDATPNAAIYYTLDNSYPSASSTRYAGPFSISSNTTIRAFAMAPGGSGSSTTSAMFSVTPSPAATPVFSPASTSFAGTGTVSITDATSGAVIYYTTDGSTPTASSTPYSAPIKISATETVQAVALAAGGAVGPTATGVYTIKPPAAIPVFSPASTSFAGTGTVSITDATSGAIIYYTTDGSTPTALSTPYAGPIKVSTTETIQALALAAGGTAGPAATGVYTITLPAAMPVFLPASTSFDGSGSVSITDATSGAIIYYTTDGSAPTASSTPYAGPIKVSTTQTIQAVALAAGGTVGPAASGVYTVTSAVANPVISPPAGTYNAAQSIVITDATGNAAIYYTTDGTRPTNASTPYTGPIAAKANLTVRATAVLANGVASPQMAAATYSIFPLAAAQPVFSPATGGKFTTVQTATLSDATAGATIYYTVDGSTPTSNSTLYAGPITVSSTETLRAMALAPANGLTPVPSSIGSLYFYIVLTTADPVISPGAGTYSSVQSVTISDATPGAVIYYTLDGTFPKTSSAIYSGPIQASNGTNIRAFAAVTNNSVSNTLGAIYSVVASPPVFSPSSGSFVSAVDVSISSATPSTTIYYTTDGSTPTVNSKMYGGSISVTPNQSTTEVVQAMATASGCVNSAVSQIQLTVTLPAGILATADVNTTPKSAIPANFLGLSQDWNNASKYLGQTSTGVNTAYRKLVSNLTVDSTAPLIMRILGDDSQLTNIQSIVEPLSELAQAVNVHYTLGVDMWNNDPSIARSETTAYMNGIPASYIDAIEIGNEPDNYWYLGPRSAAYAFPQYLTDYQTWKQAVNSSTGGAVPIMGTSAGGNGWTQGTEAAFRSNYDASLISQHYYVIGYTAGGPPIAPDFLLQASSATIGPQQYADYASLAHAAGRTFRIGESNSIWGGGAPGISNSFQAALWSVDIMFEWLNHGIDGVNWHSSNWTAYELFEFHPSTYKGVETFSLTSVNPLYYGLLAFSQIAGNGAQLLPVSTATTSNVKIWATVDTNSVTHLAVINKDETATGDVQLTLPGYSTGTVRYLSAASYSATNGITLAGQTFDGSTDGTIQGQRQTTTINAVNGVFTLPAMPVTTAAFIDFAN